MKTADPSIVRLQLNTARGRMHSADMEAGLTFALLKYSKLLPVEGHDA
jgi:hypothetical protein